ncbi:hypothetical protein [Streptomyces mesophilus]|uniref:hypothetical protein n=1 Tax=Streptomyces mesophilus TaxID=1775132 RepID=UPI00332F76B9
MAMALSACAVDSGGDSPAQRTSPSHWKESVRSGEVAEAMHVRIPPQAVQVKGAVRVNPQEDQYLLTFVTDEEQAERTAESLNAEDPLTGERKGSASGALFEHLDLAAPESLDNVRWAGVCPPCVNDSSRSDLQWIEIYVEPMPHDKARVYLQAF